MAMFGIKQPRQELQGIEFWDCHKIAVEWWLQVQDLMRYEQSICIGLDVVAIKADAEMSGREIDKEDYLKLRLIAKTVTDILNESTT